MDDIFTQGKEIIELSDYESIYGLEIKPSLWKAYWVQVTQTYSRSYGRPGATESNQFRVFRDGDGKIIKAKDINSLKTIVIDKLKKYDYIPVEFNN